MVREERIQVRNVREVLPQALNFCEVHAKAPKVSELFPQAYKVREVPSPARKVREVTAKPSPVSRTFRLHKRTKRVTLTTRGPSPTVPSPIIRTFVAYASESGTAQQYANKLHGLLMERFNTSRPGYKMFASQVVNVEQLLWIPHAELILFVVSTTGEGDPPRNGRRFYDNCLLFRYFEHKPFRNVYFATLGLGSRLYKENFGAFGVNMDRMAGDLGGTRILKAAKFDLSEPDTFTGWVEELVPHVDSICRSVPVPHVVHNSTSAPGVTEKDIVKEINEMVKKAGVTARVVTRKSSEVSAPNDDKS